jgi:glycosyltransferase involved in cell wall biosynthesis
MHYAVPVILQEAGMLERFYTDSFIGNKPALARLLQSLPNGVLPDPVRRWRDRRPPVELDPQRVRSFEAFGWSVARRVRRARNTSERRRTFAAGNQEFNRRAIRAGLQGADALYGFNGACLEAFGWAAERGVRRILEQCSAPQRVYREILERESDEWAGWQPEIRSGGPDNPIQAREEAEWALADLILCPSSFVRGHLETLGIPAERLRLVPYGVPPVPDVLTRAVPARTMPGSRRPSLRVLFVGEVGLGKGAQYLLEALRLCDGSGVEARFVGRCPLSPGIVARYRQVAEFLGPIPRSEVAAQYRWADVFCLPSLCEGSATVIYEAVMQGLAVIATPSAGPPITSKPYGVIVEPRSTTAIARTLGRYREEPDLLAAHRRGALESRDGLSRAAYGARLLDAIRSLELPGRAR